MVRLRLVMQDYSKVDYNVDHPQAGRANCLQIGGVWWYYTGQIESGRLVMQRAQMINLDLGDCIVEMVGA